MTCEWAEGYLSAYLDDALDPHLRDKVGSHIEQCARCSAILNDFDSNDHLLRALPTIQPPDTLRARIFDAPEMRDIVRNYEREAQRGSARRPRPARLLLPAAAMIALTLGATLAISQGALRALLPHQGTASQQTHIIAGPSSFNYPLAAGQRMVFLRDGALWSAPETPVTTSATAGAPQQLTPASAHVIAWQVAPASGTSGGRLVAWVDGANGALHIVRADGLGDHIVTHLTIGSSSQIAAFWATPTGRSTLNSLAWSPDGSQLAFAIVNASGASSLRVVSVSGQSGATGAAPSAVIPITPLSVAPVWSSDGSMLAWASGAGAAQRLWALRNGSILQVTTQVDPSDAQAQVASIGWSGPTLTWSTADGKQITGIFAAVPGASAAVQLTPGQIHYTAAAFNPTGGWLFASAGELWRADPQQGTVTPISTLAQPVSQVLWAPSGQVAALITDTTSDQPARLQLWSPASGLQMLTAGVTSSVTPAWSADSQRLALVVGTKVYVTTPIQQGRGVIGAPVMTVPASARLTWAPDSAALVITDANGIILATNNGSSLALVSSNPADSDTIVWSTAG